MLPGMDADGFDESRYARMRWNTPLSEPHADQLLSLLDLRPGFGRLRLADLGCGWGELLLRAVGDAADADPAVRTTAARTTAAQVTAGRVTGTGVDTDASALDRGRRRARDLRLDGQVEFVQEDAAAWTGTVDRALCVGSAHAFGGAGPALRALAPVVPAGGLLLFGDGCWPATPSAAATEIIGDQILPLAQLLAACREAGWRITHLSTASPQEWDDFESAFLAGRREWLLAHGGDPRAAELRRWLDTREREYAEGYRGVLGFAYLVLTH